eukprot:g6181.t1
MDLHVSVFCFFSVVGMSIANPEEYDDPSHKLFIGRIAWSTTDQDFRNFFEGFGPLQDAVLMRDKDGKSRGFGFVVFRDSTTVDKVLAAGPLILDGRKIDPKPAVPKEHARKEKNSTGTQQGGRAPSGESLRTNKIFIGGVSPETTRGHFEDYFSRFGKITDAIVMTHRDTGRSRGFGFVTFENTESVDRVMEEGVEHLVESNKLVCYYDIRGYRVSGPVTFENTESVDRVMEEGVEHLVDGKTVEIKRAVPRDAQPDTRRGPRPPERQEGGPVRGDSRGYRGGGRGMGHEHYDRGRDDRDYYAPRYEAGGASYEREEDYRGRRYDTRDRDGYDRYGDRGYGREVRSRYDDYAHSRRYDERDYRERELIDDGYGPPLPRSRPPSNMASYGASRPSRASYAYDQQVPGSYGSERASSYDAYEPAQPSRAPQQDITQRQAPAYDHQPQRQVAAYDHQQWDAAPREAHPQEGPVDGGYGRQPAPARPDARYHPYGR